MEIEYNPDFLPKKLSGDFYDALKDIVEKQIKAGVKEINESYKEIDRSVDGLVKESKNIIKEHQDMVSDALKSALSNIRQPNDGIDGKDGLDGSTPIFGVDFLTQKEMAQIEQRVATDVASILELQPFIVEYGDIKNTPDLVGREEFEKYKKELTRRIASRVSGGSSKVKIQDSLGHTVNESRTIQFTGSGVTSITEGQDKTIVEITDIAGPSDTDSLAEGASNLYYSDERVDDRVNDLLVEGAGISLTYNDVANTLTVTSTATGGATLDTRTDIIGLANNSGAIYYATDENRLWIDDGTTKYKSSVKFWEDTQTAPNMGHISSRNRYFGEDYATDITVANSRLVGCTIASSDNSVETTLRVSDSGELQIYLNGEWRTILSGISIVSDSSESKELEFSPIGSPYVIDVHTGDSDQLGLNGRPLVQGYRVTMGAYPAKEIISGGTQ